MMFKKILFLVCTILIVSCSSKKAVVRTVKKTPTKTTKTASKTSSTKNTTSKEVVKPITEIKEVQSNGTNTSEELVECLNTVLEGNTYLAKEVREAGKNLFSDGKVNFQLNEMIAKLSQTELKTLKLVSQKYSSREIADLLFVSVKSIENYRSRICKKLNLDARNNSLVLWCMDNKLILDNIKEFS